MLSPAAGQVMSPGSHYAPSHISDQPLTSPAAGALAPQHPPQNLPQNSAQLTRNCPQNHMHHGYYPGYSCQGQLSANCTGNPNGQVNHHASSPCAPPNHSAMTQQQYVQMRATGNCQQLSPHCTQQPAIPNPTAMSHPSTQCGQVVSQCTRPMVTPNGQVSNLHSAQQTTVSNQCTQMSPHCSQLNMNNQAKPIANMTSLQGCQQQAQQQTTPCLQMTNCAHPNGGHRPVTDAALPKRTSPQLCTAQQTNCRIQQQQHTCTHNCQARSNPPSHQQYNCNCQWGYGGDQCYHEQAGAAMPEIQC